MTKWTIHPTTDEPVEIISASRNEYLDCLASDIVISDTTFTADNFWIFDSREEAISGRDAVREENRKYEMTDDEYFTEYLLPLGAAPRGEFFARLKKL